MAVLHSLPPFALGLPVKPELYIDRVKELKQIDWSLTSHRHVLISGPRRIGKTSTLIKQYHVISEFNSWATQKIFVARRYYFIESRKSLLDLFRGLVLDVCREVLEQVFAIDMLALKAHQLRDLKDSVSNDKRILLEIYEILKSDRSVSVTKGNKYGFEVYAVGTKENSETVEYNNLSPDYVDLQSMLDKVLYELKEREFKSAVLFIDDINGNLDLLLTKEGTQLLQVLAEKGVIIVASVWKEILATKQLDNLSFIDIVELGPFKNSKDIKELLYLYTNPTQFDGKRLDFPDYVIDLIWELTHGHPQFIQEVCYRCYEEGYKLRVDEVSAEIVYKVAFEVFRKSADLYRQV